MPFLDAIRLPDKTRSIFKTNRKKTKLSKMYIVIPLVMVDSGMDSCLREIYPPGVVGG